MNEGEKIGDRRQVKVTEGDRKGEGKMIDRRNEKSNAPRPATAKRTTGLNVQISQ